MTSISGSSHDLALLETAYQVCRHIQAQLTTDPEKSDEMPWSNYFGHFSPGPNAYRNQTAEGLVLEMQGSSPRIIHTPFGAWSALGNTVGGDKIMRAIEETLGLVRFQEMRVNALGVTGPFYAITQWNGQKIERPVYREPSEYIPHNHVNAIWENFASTHVIPKE